MAAFAEWKELRITRGGQEALEAQGWKEEQVIANLAAGNTNVIQTKGLLDSDVACLEMKAQALKHQAIPEWKKLSITKDGRAALIAEGWTEEKVIASLKEGQKGAIQTKGLPAADKACLEKNAQALKQGTIPEWKNLSITKNGRAALIAEGWTEEEVLADLAGGKKGAIQTEGLPAADKACLEKKAQALKREAIPEWKQLRITEDGRAALIADGWTEEKVIASLKAGKKGAIQTEGLPAADKACLEEKAKELESDFSKFLSTCGENVLKPVHSRHAPALRDVKLQHQLCAKFGQLAQLPSGRFEVGTGTDEDDLNRNPQLILQLLERLNLGRGRDLIKGHETLSHEPVFDFDSQEGRHFLCRLQERGLLTLHHGEVKTWHTTTIHTKEGSKVTTTWSEDVIEVAGPFLGMKYSSKHDKSKENVDAEREATESQTTWYHEATLVLEAPFPQDDPIFLPIRPMFVRRSLELIDVEEHGLQEALQAFRKSFGIHYATRVEIGGRNHSSLSQTDRFTGEVDQRSDARGVGITLQAQAGAQLGGAGVEIGGGSSWGKGSRASSSKVHLESKTQQEVSGADQRRAPWQMWSVIEVVKSGNVFDLCRECLLNELKLKQTTEMNNGVNRVVNAIRRLAFVADAIPGTPKWVYTTGDWVERSPTVCDAVVYVGSCDKKLHAVDMKDGTQKWAYTTGDAVESSPTVCDGVVYVGSNDKKLHAVDMKDGTQKWAYTTGDGVRSSPTVCDGVVYVGSRDKKLHAVYAETGTQKWAYTTGHQVISSPTVCDGVVYVGSLDKKLHAVDMKDGTQKWAYTTGDEVISSPRVCDGVVYVGSTDKKLHAVYAKDGTQKWAYTTGDAVSSPTVCDGVVYVGSWDKKLHAVDMKDGTQKWAYTTGDGVPSSPTVCDGVVYVGSRDKKLHAVDMKDGTQKWAYTTGDKVWGSPTVCDGVVYVGSWDKKLHAVYQ